MKKLLVVANDFPYPPAHGAAVDMWNRVLILREMGYGVDLVATVNEIPGEDRMQTVRNHVENLWVVPRQSGVRSMLSFLPFQVRSRIDLQDVHLDQRYDGVILEADCVAPFLKNPAVRQSRLILRIHNEQVGYFRDLAQGSKNWLKKLYFYSESFKFRFFSLPVMRKCDLLWFISDSEREEHGRRNPQDARKSYFLPTHVSPTELRPFVAAGKTLTALFIGTLTISHNSDSVVWYIEKVHPLLSNLRDYSFQIAGRTAGRPIPMLKALVRQSNEVFLEEDPVVLDDLYAKTSVFVNPVIRGAGIKIKVVQALQAGLPVVSTSMGVEGTGFKDSVHVLVADTPEEFAGCVRRLLTDPALAEFLVRNAQDFLRERYDMKSNMQNTLSRILSSSV
jgi:polysaccharide biosynthesis protein PslH